MLILSLHHHIPSDRPGLLVNSIWRFQATKGLCYTLSLLLPSTLTLLQGITLISITLTVTRKLGMLHLCCFYHSSTVWFAVVRCLATSEEQNIL